MFKTPSYLNYKTFHQFLDAADRDEANYPASDMCEDAIKHFGMSCLLTNGQGQTPLMRMAVAGWDDLALALVKKHPKAAQAIDWEGRPVWYYLMQNEPYAPDPNSIRTFQRFLKFPPLKNGDCPQHLLARNILSCEGNCVSNFALNQNKSAFSIFINTPEDLLVSNNEGERPLDILLPCLHLFDSDEQNVLQELINADQKQRLNDTVKDNGISSTARKM